MCVDLKGTRACRIKAIMPKGFGKFDDAQATAITLFRVPPFTHDHIHKDLDVWTDASGLSADALGRPIDPELVMCWHVVTMCGVLAVARGSGV